MFQNKNIYISRNLRDDNVIALINLIETFDINEGK